jgi:GAF domain-containing protein
MQRQARRLTREGWSEYLDGIQRNERLAYVFDAESSKVVASVSSNGGQPAVVDQSDGLTAAPALHVPIEIAGEALGTIRLVRSADRQWSENEAGLVRIVSAQVARQADGLRLLAG